MNLLSLSEIFLPFEGGSAVVVLPPSAPDFLAALITFLRAEPAIVPLFTTGYGEGGYGALGIGEVKIWDAEARAEAYPPFLVLHAYTETLPGESIEDQPIEVSMVVVTNSLDQARAIGSVLKTRVDSVNINPNAVPRPALAFVGGIEEGVMRNASKPERIPGIGKGSRYVYMEAIDYQFWVTPDQ